MKNGNFYSLAESRFPADLDSTCIETGEGAFYTWRDMHRASGRIANWLASLGLEAGARVAVQVEKSPECLMLYLATLRAGLVYLPLNTAYQRAELEYFLKDAEPSVVVCTPARFDEIRQLASAAGCRHVETLGERRDGTLLARAAPFQDAFATARRAARDLAAILYTSGTTGRSKGAMLTHGNLASNALTLDEFWGFKSERDAGRRDVLLHALPLFHVHGLFVASHAALLAGAKTIMLAKFDLAAALRHLPRSTVFMGVPTYYTRLLSEPAFGRQHCRSMRLFISGSAPLLAETHKQFEERTGQVILERYGMSETVMLVSNPYFPERGPRIAGTVGEPLPGVGVRLMRDDGAPCTVGEIGNVQVRGPNVFPGYWRMPEKTREEFTSDGWFRTGDVGHFGGKGIPDHYLTLVGRSKDLIISGGYNVYPKEIEGYIDEMPGVVESAVIGLPHPDFGEAVAAVVVSREPAAFDAAAVTGSLKGQIANYKVPKRVFVVADLPRNAMGKVQKNVLRERYKETFTPTRG
ncbi:MAG: malonyl-CoA synthase [Burkholderiaceae bacterium]|nr:malonyl-CoA synthase [Burkholderiaceae bacterium]MDH5207750.1 malonyl-CoA synthase [Burkholderiaceae bacterium]